MGDFGAKEQAEAAAANRKPELSRGRQPRQKRQKQSADESEQQAEASSKPEKRGRKPKLTQDEKRTNKITSCRKYREKKATENEVLQKKCQRLEKENDELKEKLGYEINSTKEEISEAENEALQKKCQELEKENEELKKKGEKQQNELNLLKKELSEINAQADKLTRKMSDGSIKVNAVKMVHQVQEAGMQQLQKTFLNQGDQEHNAENSDLYIPWDAKYLENLEGMGDFSEFLNFKFSKTKEGPSSIAKAISPLRETLNVKDFVVPKENSDMIQEIVSKFPNTVSGIRFHHPASRNGFINTLAEIYEMVKGEEMLNPEEINHMEDGIEDLKCAGFEISWLEDMVVGKRLKRRKKLESQRTS